MKGQGRPRGKKATSTKAFSLAIDFHVELQTAAGTELSYRYSCTVMHEVMVPQLPD